MHARDVSTNSKRHLAGFDTVTLVLMIACDVAASLGCMPRKKERDENALLEKGGVVCGQC
jgi:hypothetical protein